MSRFPSGRISLIIGTVAVAAMFVAGSSVASAATKNVLGGSRRAVQGSPTTLTTTKTLYDNYPSGTFHTDGTISINSDGTWSLSNYADHGVWITSGHGARIILSDDLSGAGEIWNGVVNATGISSQRNPGTITKQASDTTSPFIRWYALG
jgi:hypothetical protein